MNGRTNNKLILVNSFRGSGIGDFGWKLKAEFEKILQIKYIEIIPSWRGFVRLWKQFIIFKGEVIFNMGFTSFGKSKYRNFLNFFMLKLLSISHPQQSIILHDSIDTTDLKNISYSNSALLPLGGFIATKMLKNFKIFVFSKLYRNILNKKYHFAHVYYFPFPCENINISNLNTQKMKPILLNVGYIAPYKGLDILPDIKSKMDNIDTMIIGNYSRTFISTKEGIKFRDEFENLIKNSEIKHSSYMQEDELIRFLSKRRTVAVLPYLSGYNASYAAIMFVSLGIPVVATNIDIFKESQENGAGILIVERNVNSFVDAITKLIQSTKFTQDLIEKDINYCKQYSLNTFCSFIIDLISNSGVFA